jgi:hypothetical protein
MINFMFVEGGCELNVHFRVCLVAPSPCGGGPERERRSVRDQHVYKIRFTWTETNKINVKVTNDAILPAAICLCRTIPLAPARAAMRNPTELALGWMKPTRLLRMDQVLQEAVCLASGNNSTTSCRFPLPTVNRPTETTARS